VATGLRARLVSGTLAMAIAGPLTYAWVSAHGLSGSHLELSSGGAWLASPTQGLVTLIDGASEQVVGSVRVPGWRPGDALSVVQSGSSAYMVDGTQGTVSRVDGASYEVSRAVAFADPARSGPGVTVYAGRSGTYVVDGQREIASTVDPVTLAVRQQLALAARPGPGQSIVDDDGRLWAVDDRVLVWFDGGGQHVKQGVAGPRSRLVLVGGAPVLVDPSRGQVGELGADGTVGRWSCLRTGADSGLLGSAALGRVLAVLPDTGTLVAAGDGHERCGESVVVGKPGDRFGSLAEAAGFVLVPDQTSGRTLVVDMTARQVVADLDVVPPGQRLELLAKDGIVFWNNLDGDEAGVIHFDGQRWTTGRDLHKFDRGNGGAQILAPNQQGKPGQSGAPKPPGRRPPGQQPPGQQPPGQQPPGQQPSGQPTAPAPAPGQAPTAPAPGEQPAPPPVPNPTSPGGTGPSQPAGTSPSPAPVTVTITSDPVGHGPAGDPVSFTVAAAGAAIVSASWDFGDQATGTGITVPHTYRDVRAFTVRVHATVAGGRAGDGTLTFTSDPRPTPTPIQPTLACGQTITTNVTLNVDLQCTGTAVTFGVDGISLDLGGHTITGNGNGDGILIPDGRANDAVSNGTVNGFGTSVHGLGISNVAISELTTNTGMVFGGLGTGYNGVTLDVVHVTGGVNASASGGRNLTITNSSVTGGPVNFGGDNPGPFTVQRTDLTNSSISFSESNGGQVRDSQLTNTNVSYGAGSANGVVSGNTLVGSVINWGESDGGTIDNNTLSDKSRIEVANSDNLKVTRNQITGSSVDGMQLQWSGAPPADVEISGNTVHDSLGAGIHILPNGVSQILVANNHTAGSGEFGILVSPPSAGPGTVRDGGGNTAEERLGCQGVTCA
jgi:PKD domain